MGIMSHLFIVPDMTLKAVSQRLTVMPVGRGPGMAQGTRHICMGGFCVFVLMDKGKHLPGQLTCLCTLYAVTVEAQSGDTGPNLRIIRIGQAMTGHASLVISG